MRFFAPRPDCLPPEAAQQAYLCGMEAVPWLCRREFKGQHFTIERDVCESGSLHIPWRVAGRGTPVLSTASLVERERPYLLSVELARGTLNRLRNQTATWKAMGLTIDGGLQERTRQATGAFVRAATRQNEPLVADEHACEAIRLALEAIDLLGGAYAEQVLAMRHAQSPRLATLLAGALPVEPLTEQEQQGFLAAFNAASPSLIWSRIEANSGDFQWDDVDRAVQWCHQHKLRIFSGPLLCIDQQHLPDWLYLWEDDFDALLGYVRQYVTAVVQRYAGRVHVWQCASATNIGAALKLTEEQKLRLTVVALDAVRRADPRAPIVVTFDRPWAEFMASQPGDLSPIHFADSLVRADVGMAGIGVEINYGYWPEGTLRHDILEVSRLIDHWSMLGLPLLIMLTIPGGEGEDPLARRKSCPLPGQEEQSSVATQRRDLEGLLPMLMAKQSVHALVWNQLADDRPHAMMHGGLFDAAGKPKPALESLAEFRRQHLT
ncbi:MAG: endo-1,4-beta-xylanase [Pirellulaceae bacterium]